MPVVPLVSVPRRYSTACGGADELKAYDFKVSCYVQAGRGARSSGSSFLAGTRSGCRHDVTYAESSDRGYPSEISERIRKQILRLISSRRFTSHFELKQGDHSTIRKGSSLALAVRSSVKNPQTHPEASTLPRGRGRRIEPVF